MENSREQKKSESLFEGLSLSQIIAGALAAVTSMLLASQIGIAGSVIGVAVGSIVSAVASQLYKKFLSASADKIRDLNPVVTLVGEDVQKTKSVQNTDLLEDTAVIASSVIRQTHTPHIDDPLLRKDATIRRAHILRSRKKTKRSVIAVSVVSALVAVAITAFAINFATTGEGLGGKAAPIISSSSQAQVSNGTSSDEEVNTDSGSSVETESSDSQGPASGGTSSDKPSGSGTENGSTGSGGAGQGGSGGPSGGSGGSEGGGTGSGSGSSGSGSESGAGSGSGSGTESGSGSGSGSADVAPSSSSATNGVA